MYQVLALPSRKVRGNKGRLLYSSKMQSMKARVKATGEIVEVDFYATTKRGKLFCEVTERKGWLKPDESYRKFYRDEIEFLSYEDTPDYWTRLEHQYAGMAMQAIVTNCGSHDYASELDELLVTPCIEIAHALVEKLKGKEGK
jgi:hypothetical protein